MSIDDIIALLGLLIFLTGVYLWLGIAATLITLGLILIYIGVRMEIPQRIKGHEPDKTTNTTIL